MARRRRGAQRRIPLGRPLKPAGEKAAEYSQADIDRARAAWQRLAPERFRDLLDAEPAGVPGFE